MMRIWALADVLITVIIVIIFVVIWYYHFRSRTTERIVWRCYRFQGGGAISTPKPMTLEEATQWLGKSANAEVANVDHDHGFIFYRTKG